MSEQNHELTLFRDTLKRFIATELAPYYEEWEKQEIVPREIWSKLGENGFLCVDIPEQYGGFGVDFRYSMAVQEELAYAGCFGLSTGIAVHSDIVAHYILNNGTEEQKQRYLPDMVTGACIGAIAMTEPAMGSDLQGMRTTAKKQQGQWCLNGAKTFITNGQHADLIITCARTNHDERAAKGISLFLVEATAAGFARGRNLDKIGQHSADTSELFYQDVQLSDSAILGGENGGFGLLMNELPRERLALAVGAVAHTQGAFDLTAAYVQERQAFGAPLAKLQDIRFKLADMQTEIDINRAYVDHCVELFEHGKLDTVTASKAKLASSEMQFRVIDQALQMFGGYGYMREYPISRYWADARVQRIYGGTSEIMKEIISRSIVGR